MRTNPRFFGVFSFALLICLTSGGFSTGRLIAQDDPAETPSSSPQTEALEEGNGGVEPIAGVTATGERIIYIPFKDLGTAFQNPESNVVLPYSEYKAILDAWKKRNEPAAPAEAVISTANYTVTIDGDVARIVATLKVNVLGKSWVKLPVTFGDAAVGKVTGEGVLLRGIGDGQYELLFETGGEKTVELELAKAIQQSPDGRQFSFNTPPVAVTTLDVTVPRKDQEIEVSPMIIQSADSMLENDGDSTNLQANVGATNAITVSWHPKSSLKPEMNLLSSVTNNTLVTLEDSLIHTDTWLNYEILRGSMETCRVMVPGNHRILDVTASARIKNWKTVEQDGNQVVEIEFLSAVDQPVTVEVHTEHKLENGQFDVAGWTEGQAARGIHAMDVVRESGQIAVRHGVDFNVTVAEQQGVVRIEAGTVDQRLAGNNALTYKFYSPELTLTLNAKPVEPRLMVTHQIMLSFLDDELQVANTLQYAIERAGIFEVKLKVPDGLTVDEVQSPLMKEFNFDDNTNELTVTLRERTQGGLQLSIKSHLELEGDTAQLSLPLIEPLNVERETGTIYVYARDAVEVITEQDGLEGVQPLPIQRGGQSGIAINSAWSFTRRPITIPVRTKKKPTRLSARIGTTINVQPDLTEARTQLDYVIEYAGVDTFRFEVPEAVSENLQIELAPGDQASAPIKQRAASEPADGWVTWTIETQREVLGRQRFIITYDVPKPVDDEEPSQTIQLVRPLGLIDDEGNATTDLTNTHGEVLVQKERSLSINSTATGGDIEVIDLRELTQLPQSGTIAYRYFNAAADDRPSVTISQSRFDIQEVISTVVSRGLVEIVTGEDAEATYRCRFHIKTTERQRLLVQLPVNLEVLGTYLNDREVKLEKAELLDSESPGDNWTPFWVNVARTESSDQPFILTFQFLWRVNPALGQSTFGRGDMLLPLPVIGNDESSVAQELKVTVWVPDKYALVGDPDNFDLQTEYRPSNWWLGERAKRDTGNLEDWVGQGLSCPTGSAQFPTEGRVPYVFSNLGGSSEIEIRWWNDVTITMIVSIAVALIGWVLLRTSWENKLGMLLIAAFVAALYGLKDSQALSQGLHAARFGILLLLALWLLHGIFSLFKAMTPATKTPALATPTGTPPAAIAEAAGEVNHHSPTISEDNGPPDSQS